MLALVVIRLYLEELRWSCDREEEMYGVEKDFEGNIIDILVNSRVYSVVFHRIESGGVLDI